MGVRLMLGMGGGEGNSGKAHWNASVWVEGPGATLPATAVVGHACFKAGEDANKIARLVELPVCGVGNAGGRGDTNPVRNW